MEEVGVIYAIKACSVYICLTLSSFYLSFTHYLSLLLTHTYEQKQILDGEKISSIKFCDIREREREKNKSI